MPPNGTVFKTNCITCGQEIVKPPKKKDDYGFYSADILECIAWARKHLQQHHGNPSPTNKEILKDEHFRWSILDLVPFSHILAVLQGVPGYEDLVEVTISR